MDLFVCLWKTATSKLRQCADRRVLTHQTSALRRFTRAIVVTNLSLVKTFPRPRQLLHFLFQQTADWFVRSLFHKNRARHPNSASDRRTWLIRSRSHLWILGGAS